MKILKVYRELYEGAKEDIKNRKLPKKRYTVLDQKGRFVDEFRLNKKDYSSFKKRGLKMIPTKSIF